MSSVEERLGACGADIRNLRDSISQLNGTLRDQNAHFEMRHNEILHNLSELRDELRQAVEVSSKQREDLKSRVRELESAKSFSKGVVVTVRWLVGVVAAMLAALVSIVAKMYTGN